MRVFLLVIAAVGLAGFAACGGDDDDGGDPAPKADLTEWKADASRAMAGETEKYAAYLSAAETWTSASKAKCKTGDTSCEKKLPEFETWSKAADAWADYVDDELGNLEKTAPNDEAEKLAKEAHDALHERAEKAVDIVVGGKRDEFDRLEKRALAAGSALMRYACPGGKNCPGFD